MLQIIWLITLHPKTYDEEWTVPALSLSVHAWTVHFRKLHQVPVKNVGLLDVAMKMEQHVWKMCWKRHFPHMLEHWSRSTDWIMKTGQRQAETMNESIVHSFWQTDCFTLSHFGWWVKESFAPWAVTIDSFTLKITCKARESMWNLKLDTAFAQTVTVIVTWAGTARNL